MSLGARPFTCGSCGTFVASERGYQGDAGVIYVCPFCDTPTVFLEDGRQIPGVAPVGDVQSLPPDVAALYREARGSLAASAPTAAVLTCRKLLMSIAVAQSAPEGQSFLEYVQHLADAGYVPAGGKGWVDHLRQKGNEANHEIRLMTQTDAEELISFLEMLLKFIYEFPARVPASP